MNREKRQMENENKIDDMSLPSVENAIEPKIDEKFVFNKNVHPQRES